VIERVVRVIILVDVGGLSASFGAGVIEMRTGIRHFLDPIRSIRDPDHLPPAVQQRDSVELFK
jgi:hypothetical protein